MIVDNRLVLPVSVALALAFAADSGSQPLGRPEQRPSREDILKKYDKDGDGQLSGEERQSLHRDVVEGRLALPPEVRDRIRRGVPRPGLPGRPERPFPGEPSRPPRRPPGRPYGQGTKQLDVDCAKSTGKIRPLLGVNRGPLSFPRRPGEQLVSHVESYRAVGIDFIRTHDFYGPTDWYVIFPDWSADPDDPTGYDFRSSDERIRPIVDNGFRCFYRLGTSWKGRRIEPINDPPGTIRDADGRVVHHADRDDARKWAKICVQTMRHYTEGWNDGYRFPIQYWEIWNEPDLASQFWTGSPEQYYGSSD